MGELSLAAERESQALRDIARRVSTQMRVQEEVEAANKEYVLKLAALIRENIALDQHGKDYQLKLREIDDKEKQLVQQHENEIAAIKDKAQTERNEKVQAAEDRYLDSISSGLTQVIMGTRRSPQ